MKKAVDFWKNTNLIIKIIIGLAVGTGLAFLLPDAEFIGIFGTLFIGVLKAIAPVLVAVLVCTSIASSGSGLGRRFISVIILYILSTLLAAIAAVIASRLFPVMLILPESTAQGETVMSLAEIFRSLLLDIVENPVTALVNGNYLGILFWAVIIGVVLKKIKAEKTIQVLSEVSGAISKVVSGIIQFAPFGVMGIVYTNITEQGLSSFVLYGKLILLLVGTMLFCAFVINPCIVAIVLRKNPYPLVLRGLRESGIPAFFTRSSAANIPVNMQLCEKLGIDRDFYSVTIPLGSTVNMNGAAVTITVMTLAAANTLGIQVALSTAIVLSIISTLAACGASGVAGGSLLLIPMACSLFGIGNDVAMSVVGIGFIISVIQDSVETALNSSGDVIFTVTAELYNRKKRNGKGKENNDE